MYQKLANSFLNSLTLLAILIFAIAIGSGVRFLNLEQKTVWNDEALSIHRVSGYSDEQINAEIFNGEAIDLQRLKSYQELDPASKDFDVVSILLRDNPQHPPVYYLFLRLWVKVFGESLFFWRSLSAVFSVAALAAVFLLCRELGESWQGASIAAAIASVSPLNIAYAQEAREYSLWVLTTLAASIFLLKAFKTNNLVSWLLYGIVSSIGLYVYPFTLFVLIAHGCYLLLLGKKHGLKMYGIATMFATVSYVPWVVYILSGWSETGSRWTSMAISRQSMLGNWGEHIIKLFLLPGRDRDLVYYTVLFGLLATIGYCFYLLCRYKSRSTWLFVICLTCAVFLPLATADILLEGMRSSISRYILPSLTGVQIAIALGIDAGIEQAGRKSKTFALGCLSVFLLSSAISCSSYFKQEVSWNKDDSEYLVEVSQIINQAQNPLIIGNSDGMNMGNMLSLSHLLKPENQPSFLLVDGWQKPDYENMPLIPKTFSEIYLVNMSQKFQAEVEQRLNSKPKPLYSSDGMSLKRIKANN